MYKQLKDIADIKIGYSLREGVIPDSYGNAYLLTPKDMSLGGCLQLEDATKINLTNPEKHFVQNKEVLMTARGRFTAAVFNETHENNFIASSGLHRINVTSAGILPEYVALFLNSKEGQKTIETRMETMTVPAITISQLKEISIPLISLDKQQQLINLTTSFSNWKVLRQRQEDIQSTLINQAISKIIGAKNG